MTAHTTMFLSVDVRIRLGKPRKSTIFRAY